jgi:hypothetical protein
LPRGPRYDARAPRGIRAYVAGQLAIAGGAVMAYLWIEATAPRVFLAAAALVFIATVVAWGALLERRRWAWPLEVARLVAGVGLVVWIVCGERARARKTWAHCPTYPSQ